MRTHLKEPTVEEIAEEIGVGKEEIVYALDAIQSPMSLYEPVYSEGGDTLYVMDQLSDKKNREDKLGAGFLPSRTQSAVSASGSAILSTSVFSKGKHRWRWRRKSAFPRLR